MCRLGRKALAARTWREADNMQNPRRASTGGTPASGANVEGERDLTAFVVGEDVVIEASRNRPRERWAEPTLWIHVPSA